ncbi:unnamed protein product [Caenorhabditis auriculariae]|uniref:Uncharacterized protein n=1 Tax=Caenorhabditis auriculariae TaxID=2777116 RepID=A0A8S1GTH0_9PELO|nr:unnamed protein product [Caenorhabditis auriculariae]
MPRWLFSLCIWSAVTCYQEINMTKSDPTLSNGSPSPKVTSERKKTVMRSLYQDLFRDYVKEIRPVLNESHTLEVEIKFWLKQILKVDERDQIVNIYCWLELYWQDETLRWEPSEYGNLTRIHVPSNKIWKPDVLVYNNANMNVEENEMETNAIVNHDGRVMLFRSMITDISCNLNLQQFPFDQQVCYVTFASWSMDGSKLSLKATPDTDNLELYIRNSEWTLSDFRVKKYMKVYDCCPHPFPDVTYFMVLQRSPSYYIFSLVIPSAFITVVTIVGFFTPHSTTGENTEKVSLGVTALLSMAIIMMMVSDEVPATSEVIPLIGKYYIGLIFLIFTAAFTTTLTLAYQMRGNSGAEVDPRVRDFFFYSIAGNPCISWAFSFQLPKELLKSDTRKQSFFFVNESSHNGYCKGHLLNGQHRAHVVKMEEITGSIKSILGEHHCHSASHVCSHSNMAKIKAALDDLRLSIQAERELKRIKFEWQQVTRLIDRLIMFVYIIVTILFAVFMLASREAVISLSDATMDSVKKA